MSDLVIHHMLGSRSERIVWLAEELGVPYKLVIHMPNVSSGTVKSTLTDHVPEGKAPSVVLDGDVLQESAYIMDVLLRRFPAAGVESTPSPSSIFWSNFTEGRLMNYMMPLNISRFALPVVSKRLSEEQAKGAKAYADFMDGGFHKETTKSLAQVENFLGTYDWFSATDKPGLGDFMMLFPIYWIGATKQAPGGFTLGPNTKAWVERVQARPGFKACRQRIADERTRQLPPRKPKL